MYPILPVSLDCPFFIAPWVFSNVYLRIVFASVFLPRNTIGFVMVVLRKRRYLINAHDALSPLPSNTSIMPRLSVLFIEET